jgi:hypothetical protein
MEGLIFVFAIGWLVLQLIGKGLRGRISLARNDPAGASGRRAAPAQYRRLTRTRARPKRGARTGGKSDNAWRRAPPRTDSSPTWWACTPNPQAPPAFDRPFMMEGSASCLKDRHDGRASQTMRARRCRRSPRARAAAGNPRGTAASPRRPAQKVRPRRHAGRRVWSEILAKP